MNPPMNKTAEETVTHLMGKVNGIVDWLATSSLRLASKSRSDTWPVLPGAYKVSERSAPIAGGFFVITVNRTAGDILVHHYLPDNTPAHVVQGRHGESILLALLREELISQKSHAGYLGAELAKAETALRLDLLYEQDRPLRLK